MHTILILILISLSGCTFIKNSRANTKESEKQYSKEEIQRLLEEKLYRGKYKVEVESFLKEYNITKYRFEELTFEDGSPNLSHLEKIGKEIVLVGGNDKAQNIWKGTKYCLTAEINSLRKDPEGFKVIIWVRLHFDEEKRLIACFLNEGADSP